MTGRTREKESENEGILSLENIKLCNVVHRKLKGIINSNIIKNCSFINGFERDKTLGCFLSTISALLIMNIYTSIIVIIMMETRLSNIVLHLKHFLNKIQVS